MSKESKAVKQKVAKTPFPPDFKVCDPAYSLCPDCARALRENTCPKMKEFTPEKLKKKKKV